MKEVNILSSSPLNQLIRIEHYDEPDPATGAASKYQVYLRQHDRWNELCQIKFHKGALIQTDPLVAPVMPNGITLEALLAICIDRLRSFQERGDGIPAPFSCRENALAITHLEEAANWLERRALARRLRGVEGRREK